MSVTTSHDSNETIWPKLNQVAQNFFTKAAHIILLSRSPYPGSISGYQQQSQQPQQQPTKINKWFNLELEEPLQYREDLRLWRSIDINAIDGSLVPPLVVEVYLDLRNLRDQQSLVLIDSNGRSWPAAKGIARPEVVLERWVIEFQKEPLEQQNTMLSSLDVPIIYKKLIVLMRALYTYVRLMPVWDLTSSLGRSKLSSNSHLQVGCRIVNGAQPISSKGRIGLTRQIGSQSDNTGGEASPDPNHLESFYFTAVNTGVGQLQVSVSYRKNVDFRVGDAEAILSSHFWSMDSRRSSTGGTSLGSNSSGTAGTGGASGPRRGSFREGSVGPLHLQSTYSTGPGGGGTAMGAGASPGPSGPPSVSLIKPFKSPSIGASPDNQGQQQQVATSSSPKRSSFTRIPSNSSLAALRIPRRTMSVASASSVSTTSTSAPKYSSSFGTRAATSSSPKYQSLAQQQQLRQQHSNAYSYGQAPTSTNHGSTPSSLEPGSGLYMPNTDLGDFVRMVDSASFGESSSMNVTTTNSPHQQSLDAMTSSNPLARFQSLKKSHASLTDSMQSSLYSANAAATTAAAFAVMVAAATSSSSGTVPTTIPSSGGRPPSDSFASHTPAIPSRLSEELVMDDIGPHYESHHRIRSHTHQHVYSNHSHNAFVSSSSSSSRRRSLSPTSRPASAIPLSQSPSRAGSGGPGSGHSPLPRSPSEASSSSSMSEFNLNYLLMLQSRRSNSPKYSPSIMDRPSLGSGGGRSASPRRQSSDFPHSLNMRTSPLDIPEPYMTALRNRHESLSLSNRRTNGYDEMHPVLEMESHHQSIGRSLSVDSTGGQQHDQQEGQAQSYGKLPTGRPPSAEEYRHSAPNSSLRRYSGGRTLSALYMAEESYDDDDELLFAMSDMHVTGKSDDAPNY